MSIALGIPPFIALTKADLASEAAVQQVASEIRWAKCLQRRTGEGCCCAGRVCAHLIKGKCRAGCRHQLCCNSLGIAKRPCTLPACRALLVAAVEQAGGAAEDPAALAPLVQSREQAVQLAARMRSSCIASPRARLCVPLFATSAVTGASLQLQHAFLNALPPRANDSSANSMQGWRWSPCRAGHAAAAAGEEARSMSVQAPAHFQIDATFEVADVGTGKAGAVFGYAI